MKKEFYFRTKRDASGNFYYLIVDFENFTMWNDYNIRKVASECATVSSKKALRGIEENLKECGFKHIIKLH